MLRVSPLISQRRLGLLYRQEQAKASKDLSAVVHFIEQVYINRTFPGGLNPSRASSRAIQLIRSLSLQPDLTQDYALAFPPPVELSGSREDGPGESRQRRNTSMLCLGMLRSQVWANPLPFSLVYALNSELRPVSAA
jgi:hypothetical protein